LHAEENVDLLTRLNLALQAEVLLRRDVDYIVRDGETALIDELTGRVAENRRWPHGLQAAIEAKERLAIQPEGRILNSITLQHFVELFEFYGLRVVVVPPNRPCLRRDHPDRVFPTREAKYDALVREITSSHPSGR